MYDVRADISGYGDYVSDTQSDEENNLMNLSDLEASLTEDQIGRLQWALTNHDDLKPLIRTSATFQNLVDSQVYGTIKLDGSAPQNSPYTINLLDKVTHTIETTDRQITYESNLHQLAHWEDGSYEVRPLKFHQSETFDFDKKNPDWYGRFNQTYAFSVSTSPSGVCDVELEDPWADEDVFFKPTTNYPVFVDYNDEFLTSKENYQVKAPVYCATTSHIYHFTGWTCSPAGKAVFQNSASNLTKVDFQEDEVEVIANYTAVENQTNYTATIPSGETLSIPAGANISFASGFTLGVVGAISALGTEANPISLTGTGKAVSYTPGSFNPTDTLIVVASSNAELELKHVNIEDVKCGIYFDGDNISADLTSINFENTNVGIFIDRVIDNSIEIDSVVFTDNNVHVSFSDGLAEDNQTSTIKITNSVFTGDCDYAIWAFPKDDMSSYNSKIDLIICSNVFYDDNDIDLHAVAGDWGEIDVELYNNIFHTSFCGLGAADDVDAGFNLGYNTSTAYMGDDVITDDPLMNDPANGDFTLAINSPCIDAGGDEFECLYLPEFDPDGTTPDIGAFYCDYPPETPTGYDGLWYNNHPKVYWTAVGDPDLDYYEVWKRRDGVWSLKTTTTALYYIDTGEDKWTKPMAMETIYYRVRSVDEGENSSGYTLNESFIVNNKEFDKEEFHPTVEIDPIPTEFRLHPVYPNPFNATTTLKLDLPEETRFSLAVYDIAGNEVWRLNNRRMNTYPAGYHTIQWDGHAGSGSVVPTGVYFIVYRSTEHQLNQKVVLVK